MALDFSLKKLLYLSITVALLQCETSFGEEPIQPILLGIPLNNSHVQLGEKLFHDPLLSENRTISCASCHNLKEGGADKRTVAIGINGGRGLVNTPTVYNSSQNFRQFWNGRAKTLEEQVDGPINHVKEMGASWELVISRLNADPEYREQFKKLFSTYATVENVKKAIATFERSLVTPNSRFDLFLQGKKNALTDLEISGYQKFKNYGCIACHQGINVGGNMFQTMGIMGNYFRDRGTPITEGDLGKYNVTKKEEDRFVFRVPSLRNIELTAPYFHDGSAVELQDAVKTMAKYQLGRKLSAKDTDSIVAFLKTLTGENRFLTKPSSIDKNK